MNMCIPRGFGDLGSALAASRAMQVAFEGFRTAVPAGRANVSMVLDSSLPDEASAGLSVDRKTCWTSRSLPSDQAGARTSLEGARPG